VSGTSISYPLAAPHEQPTPGSSYRVQGVLRYAGGIARLDTRVVFSHAAAVKQENYGGRKLPKSTPAWRWLVLLLLALAMVIGALKLLQRRRRPLNRPAGLKLLDRYLGPDGERPVSLVLIRADGRTAGAIASTIHPRLRRSDRVCDLGRHGVLVICPRTTRPAANALRDDIEAQLARHPGVGGIPIKIAVATANKTTTAQKLLDRVTAARHQQPPKLSPRRRPTTTGKR
ncbi:MAG TPA: hypothetical protein VGG07_02410, partial [Solirubrobacteraceae bacterium]